MYYINSTPDDTGNYGNPASTGELALPDELLDSYVATMGFAVLEVSDGVITAVSVNRTALDAYLAAHPSIEPSPSQQRENAYNTEKLVTWGEENLTVTEAAQKWQYYAAEGDAETTAELSALIAAAKAEIRERIPDESEENNNGIT